MADTKISALPASTVPLAGTEVLPIVQSSTTKQVSVANLTAGLGTITAAKGGTGQTSYAVGDLLYADTTTTLAKLPDVATGNALISGGVTTAPSWGKIGLTTHVSGTLPVANGGTGITSLGTGVATALGVNVGSAGAFVVNGGALGTPSSGTVTNLTGTASININGTVGATTTAAGYFTTVNASLTITGGNLRCSATNIIGWTAQGGFESVSDGVYKLYNEARNAYGSLTLSSITFGTGQFFSAGVTSGTSASAYTTIAGTNSGGASTSWNVGVNAFRTDASYAIQNSGGTGLYLVTGNTAWTATSDERLKDIIEPITNAVDKVKNLRTVIGKFKNDESGKRRPFLMAQDFLNSLPEVVDVSDPEAFGLMYSETIVLAFAAIKELAERIEILEAKG